MVPADEDELAAILSKAIESCSAEARDGPSFRGGDGRPLRPGRAPCRRPRGRAHCWWASATRDPGGRPEPSDRRGRAARRRAHAGHRPLDGVPGQSEGGGLAAARQADRRRWPPRGRRGLRLADHDGPGRVPPGTRIDADPGFAAWLKRTRPLTSLTSLRTILDLDRPRRADAEPTGTKPRRQADGSSPIRRPDVDDGSEPPEPHHPTPVDRIIIGTTSDRRGEPVAIEPAELTRHAASSARRAAARRRPRWGWSSSSWSAGIPAILVDRKGDLCAYARPDMGLRAGLDGDAGRAGGSAAFHGGGRPVHAATARRPAALDRGRARRPGWRCRPTSASRPPSSPPRHWRHDELRR